MGIELGEDDITSLFLQSEYSDKLWCQLHQQKESVKINQIHHLYQKLKKGILLLKKDNAKQLGYQSGMMGPGGKGEVVPETDVVKNGQAKKLCKHCGSTSHLPRTSLQCPMNPKNKVPAIDGLGE
jgi:hypothetical protein